MIAVNHAEFITHITYQTAANFFFKVGFFTGSRVILKGPHRTITIFHNDDANW